MGRAEVLHQDGSRHDWLVGHLVLDLIVTLDDATSAIYSAFLVQEEGTQSSFRGIGEVIERQGLFCDLYTDQGSHYFHTPKAGAEDSLNPSGYGPRPNPIDARANYAAGA